MVYFDWLSWRYFFHILWKMKRWPVRCNIFLFAPVQEYCTLKFQISGCPNLHETHMAHKLPHTFLNGNNVNIVCLTGLILSSRQTLLVTRLFLQRWVPEFPETFNYTFLLLLLLLFYTTLCSPICFSLKAGLPLSVCIFHQY